MEKEERKLREQVFAALRNARENGYDFTGWTARQIAEDIQEFDADLEDKPLAEIILCVVDWWVQGGHK